MIVALVSFPELAIKFLFQHLWWTLQRKSIFPPPPPPTLSLYPVPPPSLLASLNRVPHLTHIWPGAEVQWDNHRSWIVSYFSLSLSLHPLPCPQETRKRHPVSDRAKLCSGHSSGCGPLPAPEERLESADDRRVLGQQTETIQPRCPRVSLRREPSLYFLTTLLRAERSSFFFLNPEILKTLAFDLTL